MEAAHLDSIRQQIDALAQRLAAGDVAPAAAAAAVQEIGAVLDRLTHATPGPASEANPLPTALLATAAHHMYEALVITEAQLEPPGPRFVYVNDGFTQITGYTPEEVIGKTPRILHGPQTDRAKISQLRHDLEQHGCFRGETVNYRKDGTAFVMDWYVKPLRDQHGTITHWMAVQHDVTQRRRGEAALDVAERSNVQLAAAISKLTTGTVITDPTRPDNPITFVNPGFCTVTGYSEQEVIGRNCRLLQGPDTDPKAVQLLHDAIAERRTTTVELLNYTKDGTPFWNELTVDPVFDSAGQLIHFVGLQTDITARKQAETEREQLFQQAQDAVRVRDDFLKVAAHELKTPVTSMRAYAQLLLRQTSKEQPVSQERLTRVLTTIDQQSVKLVRLTDQLLDIARLESGRLQITREPTDIAELVRGVVATMQPITIHHTLAVTAPTTLESMVDPIRLEQVVTNLLTNAIKYSPEGGPIQIDVATAGDECTISVSDQGIGIAPEHRERIFDRFFQAQNADVAVGMGIGLFISHQIVLLHGGHLAVEPLAAGGTRFVVHVPLAGAATSV